MLYNDSSVVFARTCGHETIFLSSPLGLGRYYYYFFFLVIHCCCCFCCCWPCKTRKSENSRAQPWRRQKPYTLRTRFAGSSRTDRTYRDNDGDDDEEDSRVLIITSSSPYTRACVQYDLAVRRRRRRMTTVKSSDVHLYRIVLGFFFFFTPVHEILRARKERFLFVRFYRLFPSTGRLLIFFFFFRLLRRVSRARSRQRSPSG